ncbi:M48 family metalloprotease [Dongia sedimenti]|uniref:M48 family metalloprotease n=1 Tax=Dongia sedimenti TaxID=3064282 RepID=A0ABU0YV09_9PROT|nr:M48 family metalloprotease [Rhodospirillaceae bacterium R-7]
MINRLLARAGCLAGAVAAALVQPLPAAAQGRGLSLIRDAEIEATIRAYAEPVFKVAGLDAAAIKVHLVNDNSINAFVTPGMNMFINTGLLIRADTPNQVIGVIAHETGHIAGGHLVRIQDELRNATIQSILAMIAGIGAGVATGNAGVGAGTMMMGQGMAMRNVLKYSRTQEASADQAGMGFLDDTHQSARGMLQFFEKLESQMLLNTSSQDPYLQTHPLTRDRVDSVQQHVDHSPYSDAKDPPDLVEKHRRMLAKLKGFLWPLDQVMLAYPKTDTSQPARYARAIAFFRVSRMKEALILMDSLLKESPDDAFYIEQKGQILFQNGRLADALPLYQRAVEIRPHEALLRQELGQVQLETEDQRYVKPAIANLEFAAGMQANDPDVWRLLAIAYGRDGQLAMSALAQAQQAMAAGDKKEARLQARRAQKGLPSGSPAWMQADAIISAAGGPDGEDDE